MERLPISAVPYGSLRLGDMVTPPGELPLSIRASASLPENVLGSSHLLVLGEMQAVLLLAKGSVAILGPVPGAPPGFSSSKLLCSGLVAFWAPHLPSAAGATAELEFQLRMARTSLAPMVSLRRGPEMTVFVLSGSVPPSQLTVAVTRSFTGRQDSRRFAAQVGAVSPVFDPRPENARPLPRR